MRAAAAGLRLRAERIIDVATRVEHSVTVAVYEGPAADRLRCEIADGRRRSLHTAARIQEIADHLLRAAAALETQLEEQRLEAERAGQWPAEDC
jgi:hypothetical protein